MNWSKEWGDSPEAAVVHLDAAERARQKRLLVLLAIVLGGAILAGLLAAGWYLLRGPQSRLAAARTALADVLDEPDGRKRAEQARQAEELLRRNLAMPGGADAQPGSRLLLAATRQVQGGQPVELPEQAELIRCSTEDLLLAAEVFLHSDALGLADRLLQQALERPDRRPRTLRLAIQLYYQLGRQHDTLEHCRELAQLDPRDPQPWLIMALVYERRSEWLELIEPLRKYIALAPDGAEAARVQLVGYLTRTRQLSEARELFDQLQQQVPQLVREEPLIEARLLHAEGRIEDALAVLQERPQQGDDAAAALQLQGEILLALARPQPAVDVLRQAVALDPPNHEAHHLLGQAYARLGKRQQAEHHRAQQQELLEVRIKIHKLEQLAAQQPANVPLRLELARLCQQVGWDEMEQQWRQAAEAARELQGAAR